MEEIVDMIEKEMPDLKGQMSEWVKYAGINTVFEHSKEPSKYVIAIPLEDYDIKTAVHESVHCAWDILDAVGVKLDAENNEALAYLTEYIFDKVEVICNKQHKLLTKKTKRA